MNAIYDFSEQNRPWLLYRVAADETEKHKKKGGNPDIDVSCIYLKALFLSPEKYKKIESDYKNGKLLSKDVKQLFADEAVKFIKEFQSRLKKVTDKDVDKAILKNN